MHKYHKIYDRYSMAHARYTGLVRMYKTLKDIGPNTDAYMKKLIHDAYIEKNMLAIDARECFRARVENTFECDPA